MYFFFLPILYIFYINISYLYDLNEQFCLFKINKIVIFNAIILTNTTFYSIWKFNK